MAMLNVFTKVLIDRDYNLIKIHIRAKRPLPWRPIWDTERATRPAVIPECPGGVSNEHLTELRANAGAQGTPTFIPAEFLIRPDLSYVNPLNREGTSNGFGLK